MKTAKSTKGQNRLCTLGGRIRERVRRFLSITLCVCMAVCGMPAIPALAKPINEDDDVQEFTLLGADISAAIAKAMKGDPVSEEDYRFFGAMEETYEELFYGSEETAIDIYELFPKIEKDKDGSLSLRIFLRIDESERKLDASGFTGEEQLIFLLLNSGKEEQTARVYVDDNMTGLIKVAPRKDVLLDKADLTDITDEDSLYAEETEEAPLAGAKAEYEDETGVNDTGIPDITPPSFGGAGAGTGAGTGAGAGAGIGASRELPDHDDLGKTNDAEVSDDGNSDQAEGDLGDDGSAYDDGYDSGDHYGNAAPDTGNDPSGGQQSSDEKDSSSDEGNDSDGGSDNESGSTSDGENSSDGEGGNSSEGGSTSDGGNSSDGGSASDGRNSQGTSGNGSSEHNSSDHGSSDGGSSEGGMSLSSSMHHVGLLMAKGDEEDDDEDETEVEIVIELEDDESQDMKEVEEPEVEILIETDEDDAGDETIFDDEDVPSDNAGYSGDININHSDDEEDNIYDGASAVEEDEAEIEIVIDPEESARIDVDTETGYVPITEDSEITIASQSDASEEEVYKLVKGETLDAVLVRRKNRTMAGVSYVCRLSDMLTEDYTLTYEGDDFTLKITYNYEAGLPADVTLDVSEYEKDSETYRERLMEAADFYGWDKSTVENELDFLYGENEEAADRKYYKASPNDASYDEDSLEERSYVDNIRIFDISLYVDDEKVEPMAEVDVEFSFTDQEDDAEYKVIHFMDDDETEEMDTETSYENDAQVLSFRVAEFSDFMVVSDIIRPLAVSGAAGISSFSVSAQVDGTAPWDSNDGPGNDSNAGNNIVRTFDYVNYTLAYTTELSDPSVTVDSGNIYVEFTLPCGPDVASFNLNSVNWMEKPVVTYYESEDDTSGTTEYTNGMEVVKQVLTGYRVLVNTSDNTAIPGTGTLSVGIYIGAAKNGTTLKPEFTAWMDNNDDKDKVSVENQETVTISAAQKYNIGIRQASEMNIAGTYDLSTGNEYAAKDTVSGNTSVRGRMEGYGVTVMLQNDSVDKGLKGLEFPTDTITFDLTLSEQAENRSGSDLSSTAGYTPVIWDYDANLRKTAASGGSVGLWERTWVYTNANNRDCAYGAAPYNKLGCHTYSTIYDSCYDGGSWYMEQDSTDPLVYHVTISDYTIDYLDYNFPTANNTWYARTEEGTVYTANQACLSAGTTQMVLQFPENAVDAPTYIYYKMVANNFKVGDIAYDAEATYTNTYQLVPEGSIQSGTNFTDDTATSRAQSGHQLGSGYMEGDAYSFIGTNIRLWGYQSTTTDEYVRTKATLIKFDADAFEVNRSDQYYENGRYAHGSGNGTVHSFTRYFTGRSSNWESTQVMSDTLINSTDLCYYTDLDALESAGLTCVGVLYIADVEDLNTSSQSYGMIGLTVKDDSALIGNVYAACNDSWASYKTQEELEAAYGSPITSDGTINTDWARNGYNLYKAYCSLSAYETMKTTIESGNNGDYWYHKTEYGSDGNIIGGHDVGYYGGTSLLICGEKSTVAIKTDQSVYDMDSGQRTTVVTVSPTVTVDGNASSGTGDKGTTTTTVTVKVTLPADLTYDEGTACWGDTAITPVVTVNDDGSTVLTFTLENVTVGETLDDLTFSCTIGHAGTAEDVTNNQEIELNATIESTNDHRAKEESFGNSSTTSFNVIKLSATSISKSVDNRMIELNGSFTWTLNFFNGGTGDMSEAVMADVFPKNGVLGSSFSGDYTISEIVIDFSKAPNSYNDDDGEMNFYISNEYSGNGSDLAKGGIPTGNDWYDLIDGSESDDHSERIISLSVPDDYADSLKAFYFNLGNLDSVETVIIRVYVQTKGNDPGDIYNNLFYESSSGQETPVQSNLVSTQVVQRNISGRTWYDVNDNGLQDNGENLTPDVTVTLYGEDGESEVTDVYGNIVKPQVTGENGLEKGAYRFSNLPAGTYRVEFSNVHSDVYELAKRNIGTNDTIDSDAKLVSTDNDDLIAEITGINLPAIADMDRYLYESNYNDAGYVMKYVDVEGEKTWEDDEDRDGDRPESIVIRLLADGVEIDKVTVPDAYGNWSWSFKNLPRGNDEGIKITYTVTEDAIDHYQSEYDGYDVINVHSPSTTSLTVVKAWDDRDDQDGIRPGSITVELLANGEETGKILTLASSSNWQGTFKDLYMYHDEGEKYSYTIKEIDAPPGYEAVISGDPSSGYVLTNTHTSERIDIPVSKVWRDNNDEYEDRPHSVTVALLADGEETGDRLTLDDSNDWSGTFKDRYKYYYGREIVYEIEEVTDEALKDYKPKVTKIEDENGCSFEITNYRAYFPIDEEIVTNQDDIFDRDNWKKNESVNEYNAIQFEMTTKLPYMDMAEVKAGEVTLNFHEILDSDLILDEAETHFTVYIAGYKVDAQYYKVTISPDDECSFHVDVDLTSLCKDGIVSEDDLENNAEITIFFFADLEGTDLNGSYKSTIWYDIYDADTWLYTSNESVVEVYTYEINVTKYDSSRLKGTDYAAAGLAGATLGVYYDIDCKEPVSRRGESYTVTSGEDGSAIFYGLAAGTYYVKETKAPDGYSLSSTVMIAILDDTLNNDTDYYTYNGHYGNTPSSSGSGVHHSGGSGGGSTGGSGTVVGGPGESYDSEGESWDLSPLANTGQGRAMLFGTCALAVSAMALIVLLFFKRREKK